MKFNLTKLTNKMGRTGLKLRKAAPDILFAVGIVSTVGGVIYACTKTTPKCKEILDNHKANMNSIEEAKELAEKYPEENEYPVAQQKKDRLMFRKDMVVSMVKTCAPAAVMIGGGLFCLHKSNRIFKKRYLGAAAAFAADHKELKMIKDKLFADMGRVEGKSYIYGLHDDDVEFEEVDADGEKVTVTKPVNDIVSTDVSQYAKYFNRDCLGWDVSPEHNLAYLSQIQSSLTDILLTRGYVFLNEAYQAIGLPQTPAGQLVGWLKGMGDNYVDFGIYNANLKVNQDFINGYENICLLDFNVDGIIYDLI